MVETELCINQLLAQQSAILYFISLKILLSAFSQVLISGT